MPHIRDVATRAGVSVATVSRVLNHHPRVKPRLREQVLAAIQELGYQPSGIAANMRSQSLHVIGLVISDIQNPFFTTLVRAVEDVAHANQYTVLLCNSDEDVAKERLYINVLSRERVAGVIIVPTGRECCEQLSDLRVPIVLVDRKIPGLRADAVVLNNIKGAWQATRHLIGLGHTRIGLISAPRQVSVGQERRLGYVRALRAHHLPLDESLIATGNFKEKGGYEAAHRLLSLDPPPTALFAVNNLMTMGALQAIHERKLRIPDDISIVGFDDTPWLPLLSPPLTAVRQPTYEIGAEAARRLFAKLQNPESKTLSIVLEPELVIRGSTAAPSPKGTHCERH